MNGRTRIPLALALVAAGAIAAAPPAAMAQTQATSSFNVTLTVPAGCTVLATAAAFPDSSGAVQQTAQGTVTVNCPDGTTYDVGLDAGIAGTDTQRYMSNGADQIDFGLYSDAAYNTEWGDQGLSGTPTFNAPSASGIGNGADQALPVYALLPPFSGKSAGNYSDTVNVIVEF